MNEDFTKNLRLLCGYYRSIAEVCRKLQINRPQFNKYLSGNTLPSRHILRQICDFFGVEEYEIFLPHSQFTQIIRVRPSAGDRPMRRPYIRDIDQLQRQTGDHLRKYLGYYFEYHHSMAYPGHIIRSLVHIAEAGEGIYYRRVEHMRFPDRAEHFKAKYRGAALFLCERIFLVGYETFTLNEVTQTVLFPTYKNRISYLSGLKLGVSAGDRREPLCTRVVMEYLGSAISLKSALRLCGLFGPDSTEIDPSVRHRIDSDDEPSRHLFPIPAL